MKYSSTLSAPENNTYNKKENQKCQVNFLALKVAFLDLCVPFKKQQPKNQSKHTLCPARSHDRSLSKQQAWVQYRIVQLHFCFEQEINLKKSTRNVVVDFSLIAPVVRIWMCFYLAMYSTDINVIECCCSAQPPLFKLKATKCLTHTCILFWKNKTLK